MGFPVDLVGVAGSVLDGVRHCARLFSIVGIARDGTLEPEAGELPTSRNFEPGVRTLAEPERPTAEAFGRMLSR